ncbi:hypothetical protein GCM10022254_32740 [Actinomadura meridiana]|uniref:Uncharacterized protein n=1 Tax=Actinomadura meridiana TaxID=559626 RepID=A0ABP8C2Q0_9ACTN
MSEEHGTSPELPEAQECPYCGSDQTEDSTTIDLAFGEEIACKVCKNCGRTIFDEGT